MSDIKKLFLEWARAAGDRTDSALRDVKRNDRPSGKVELVVGQHSETLRVRHHWGKVDMEAFRGAEQDALVAAIREKLNPIGWPMRISADVLDESWRPVRIADVGIFGVYPRSRGRHSDADDIEDLFEASSLLARIIRPSNRPVRSWSTQSDMAGSDFVSILGIHARTEPEAILKKLHMMNGIGVLRELIDGKPLPDADWITRLTFIASDLEDLDEFPLGRKLTGADAISDLRDMIANISPAEPEDEAPGP